MPLTLSSPAFADAAAIPARHSCDGEGVSPALRWSDAPGGTRCFALIVDDPDAPDPAAPRRIFVHWVLHDLPATASGLDEGVAPGALPAGARSGRNDAGGHGWTGPCPPIGRHRYFFRLHALDAMLGDLGADAGRAEVEAAMAGHILETAELMGTYERGGRRERTAAGTPRSGART